LRPALYVAGAWPVFSAFADEAMAATIADNEAIENYGKEE
jgi:hypothetical protein